MTFSPWTRFLIAIGLRSKCHGAKIFAWSWNKHYCDECGGKLNY
jgi:rRNA maturation endonuclease Nob1